MLSKLRSHQVEPTNRLLELFRSSNCAIDWSSTGTGKTYVSAAVIAQLGLPTLVVGPKISRTAWTNALSALNTSASFCNYELLRGGNQPYGRWDSFTPASEYFKCEVCQCKVDLSSCIPCLYHPRGIHCVETHRVSPSYGQFTFAPEIGMVVFDESHRSGGIDSLNCELVLAAKRQRIKTLCLSATPANTPLQFRALGYLLGLHNDKEDLLVPLRFGRARKLPSFKRWLRSKEVWWDVNFRGYKWFASKEKQLEIMAELRREIIPSRGVRVTTQSIPGFPTCQIDAELYDLDNPAELNRVYEEMRDAVEQLKTRSLSDKAAEHPLTKILRARQQVELLKVPIFSELAEDYRAKELSVVFFVNFRQTIDELQKRFPDAGIIDGQTKNRELNIQSFQQNKMRELLVNCEAGKESMSLHDLCGGFPRAGLVSPCFSASTMRQIFGRLPREGGRSHSFYKVLFAAGTIEENIWRSVRGKLNALDTLLTLSDSDWTPDNLRLNRDIL